MSFALQASLVIVTNNIADFAVLHNEWQASGLSHAGIVLFPQQRLALGEVVRRLLRLRQSLTAEEMRSRLE